MHSANINLATSVRVLVVDDEETIRWSLRQGLEAEGLHVIEAGTGMEGLEAYRTGIDLVILDWELPDINGLEVFHRMKTYDPTPPVIMLTAHANVPRAVEMMRAGGFDFLDKGEEWREPNKVKMENKPFSIKEVMSAVRAALEARRHNVKRPAVTLRDIIGQSDAAMVMRTMVERAAISKHSPVLIFGESGTGKGLVARAIHAASDRIRGPFVSMSCTAIAEEQLAPTLFGREVTGSTGRPLVQRGLIEEAAGGTLFLEHIAALTLQVQADLVKFLDTGVFQRVGGNEDLEADVRVLVSTSVDPRETFDAGKLDQRLYNRLRIERVEVPPLREREGDIPLLIDHFISEFNREFEKNIQNVTPAALTFLEQNAWPGNVRELRNTIERAVIYAGQDILDRTDFETQSDASVTEGFTLPEDGVDMERLEKSLVEQALIRSNLNRTKAGRLLGMNRDQIRYRIEKYEINEDSLPTSNKRPRT